MAPEHQPGIPAGLRPETAVVCAGRPGHEASEPLNVPLVLASNFRAEGNRSYARTGATQGSPTTPDTTQPPRR
jgi:hypothetical protein